MRKGLDLLFRGINFAHASLSRQMEYNADLVAVSVTGSDALVFGLARLDFAAESLGQAWTDLTAAADHGRYTRDLYLPPDQGRRVPRRSAATTRRSARCRRCPADPTQTVQVFKPEDTSVPKMWATHPSNHDRESQRQDALLPRPRSTSDRPWELFCELRARSRNGHADASTRVARKVRPERLEDPEAIQAFIDAEHAETTYDPRYQGLVREPIHQAGRSRRVMHDVGARRVR